MKKNEQNQNQVIETIRDASISTVEKAVKQLLGQSKGDSIHYTDNGSNNVTLETSKLKVQVSLELGREMETLYIDEPIPVTITKVFDIETITKTIRLPVIQLLLLSTNGIFELVNTNPKDKIQFNDLMLAFENGYSYPSSYQASLKREPFSYASFIGEINIWLEHDMPSQYVAQWQAAKSKSPRVKELSAFLDLAFDSPKWIWLRERMLEAGYTKPVVSDDMEDLL